MTNQPPAPPPPPGWQPPPAAPPGWPPPGAYGGPPGPSSKPAWYRRTWVVALATFLLGIGIGAASASGGGDGNSAAAPDVSQTTSPTTAAPTPVDDTTSAPTTAPTSEPPPPPKPDGTYTSSCDYVLGDFSSNTSTGFRFVATANAKNSGNIGTVLEMRAQWFQVGTKAVTRTKKVKIEAGRSKRIGITVPVSQDQIDLIPALPYNQECKVKVTIVDTFGEPRAR